MKNLKGREWVAAARKWIQWNDSRGDSVTWGSEEPLRQFTVREIEELSREVAAAAIEENEKELKGLLAETQVFIQTVAAFRSLSEGDVRQARNLGERIQQRTNESVSNNE